MHLKEKRFFCNYCNKGYLERPRLILHIKWVSPCMCMFYYSFRMFHWSVCVLLGCMRAGSRMHVPTAARCTTHAGGWARTWWLSAACAPTAALSAPRNSGTGWGWWTTASHTRGSAPSRVATAPLHSAGRRIESAMRWTCTTPSPPRRRSASRKHKY